jgi:16S rRNA (cytidine1402-2'-O)-methyltransferase
MIEDLERLAHACLFVCEFMAGAIYLVATPIGNLEDITLRALRTLREADVIACEDTRHTGKLLAHFEIHKPLVSYHEHNEARRAAELIERAKRGEAVAVVSDAGTPGISDPGFRVVRAAVEADVPVISIPGPVAAISALAASGLPTDAFRFVGFLPAKKSQRRKALESLQSEDVPLILYEAPRRVVETLEDVLQILGDRPLVVARELTKLHEEYLRGTVAGVLDELHSRSALKGEMTVLIGRGTTVTAPQKPLAERVAELIENHGLPRMDAIKQAARERNLSKREAYERLQSGKDSDEN